MFNFTTVVFDGTSPTFYYIYSFQFSLQTSQTKGECLTGWINKWTKKMIHAYNIPVFQVGVDVLTVVFWKSLSDNASSYIRGDADKSLAQPTSRCRRTESIVSLERGVCSCAELQVISCYRGWKEACQATRAISTTSRSEISSFFPPVRQGAEGNSRHSDRNIRGTCTVACHRQKLGGPI